MPEEFEFIVKSNRIAQIIKELPEKKDDIVRALAFRVEQLANMIAPYKTTALRNSIYTRTSQESGYSEATGKARGLRPGVGLAEEAPEPQKGEAYVGVGVNYGIFVELGTSRMGAQPFLAPALQQVKGEAEEIVKKAFDL